MMSRAMIHARVAVVGIELYICEVVCSACRVKPATGYVKDLTHQGLRESIMAARCAVCGKGPQTGFTVSHSHRRTKRSFRPNLQSVRTTIDGENTRLRVCGKCLKAGKVQRVAA